MIIASCWLLRIGASSAYIFFSGKIRQTIKDENPDMPNKEILRETGARWNALTPEQKAPFEKMQAEDKER